MEESHIEEVESQNKVIEVAPALVSVHPSQKSIAVTVGSDLRVFDLVYDKLVKIWSAESWHCLNTISSEKRVSAVAISGNDSHVCFADKFGVIVYGLLSSMGSTRVQVLPSKKGAPLLSHYCSIITSLEFSPDGRYILSADRDFKIRVSYLYKELMIHEIQTFCLGHTEFVTCIAFVWNPELPQKYLMSGSGDSTVRLWDVTSGSLLNTCEVSTMAGHLESNESKPVQVTVTDICAIPNSSSAAVSIQRQVYFQGIVLLKCDLSSHTLSIAKFHPPLSTSTRLLWMVSGASNGSNHPTGYSRVRVTSGIETEPSSVLEDEQIPGGTKLLEQLQGKVSVEESVMSATAEAVRAAMSSLLMKKQYSDEKREFRKRSRNDKKTTH
ncbi:unnamed protein product [Brassica napus]|uniref:tRNA (guanine-N(7)-)-methyltransferase non-catalytic subunit n=1 Tax=Brassica napus TaxID=3708 RepID=A0A817B0I0_BRANA|nr:unnamed protein product [Brassica napus]